MTRVLQLNEMSSRGVSRIFYALEVTPSTRATLGLSGEWRWRQEDIEDARYRRPPHAALTDLPQIT